jgi:hypothetical protein
MRRILRTWLVLAAALLLVACQTTTDIADPSARLGPGSALECLRDRLGVLGTHDDLIYVTGDLAAVLAWIDRH